jgi:prevent-host-death family protein
MTAATFSSREFNQHTARVKRAAAEGPVYITDRGEPAHVLLTFEHYQQLTGHDRSIVDLLSRTPGVGEVEFDPPRRTGAARPADLAE